MEIGPWQATVTALTWVGAGLLAWAGVAKQRAPDGAMATLHRLRLPSGRVAARLLGLGELAVGAAVVLLGRTGGAVVLLTVFTALTAVSAWTRRAQVACGCFGSSATAVSRPHVAMNGAFALTGVAGAAIPAGPAALRDVAADAGAVGVATATLLLATAVGLMTTLLRTRSEAIAA